MLQGWLSWTPNTEWERFSGQLFQMCHIAVSVKLSDVLSQRSVEYVEVRRCFGSRMRSLRSFIVERMMLLLKFRRSTIVVITYPAQRSGSWTAIIIVFWLKIKWSSMTVLCLQTFRRHYRLYRRCVDSVCCRVTLPHLCRCPGTTALTQAVWQNRRCRRSAN